MNDEVALGMLMENVRREMEEKLKSARLCGALPEGVHSYLLCRMVLQIVADNLSVDRPDQKRMLKNLRRFI